MIPKLIKILIHKIKSLSAIKSYNKLITTNFAKKLTAFIH